MHGMPPGPVFAVYYPILAAIAIPANTIVIVILSQRRCGLSRCIAYYLVSMAVTDLLVMVTAVMLNRIIGIHFPNSFFSITPLCSLRHALSYATIDSSAWLTVAFTFDRFVAVCCDRLKMRYCTEKTAMHVIGIVTILCCVKSSFLYFITEAKYIIENVPWFCKLTSIFYTSPAWAAYDWIRIILTPCLAFILIILLNALTVKHILAANRIRRRLRTQNNEGNQIDPEMEKRKRSMVLLFAISGSFILSYFLFFYTTISVRIANIPYSPGSDLSNSAFIIEECGYILQFMSSFVNPFIYAGTQNKFRAELINGLKYLLNLIVNLCKYCK